MLALGAVLAGLLYLMSAAGAVTPKAAATDTCPNKVFRTGPSSKLPDCRAYELVTPRYTAGINPFWSSGFSCCPPNGFNTHPVSRDGNSTAYMSLAALPGLPGNGYLDEYRAVRTDEGWVTELNGPTAAQAEKTQPGGATDGGRYSFEQTMGTISPDLWPAFAGLQSTQLLRTPDGVEPIGRGSLGDVPDAEGRYISPDGKHVIFQTCRRSSTCPKLEENAPENLQTIYDRTPGGPTQVVSLLPGDRTPSANMEYFGATNDGTEVAFAEGSGVPGGSSTLYVRRDNTTTVEAIRPRGVTAGKTLECVAPPVSGATIEIQWLRNGSPIPGETNPKYEIGAADEGTLIQCRVTRSNAEGSTLMTTPARPVAPYAGKNLPETEGFAYITPFMPAIAVGEELTCNKFPFQTLSWEPEATVSYQWLRSGAEIPGATSSTYSPTDSDLGDALQCRVTGTTPDGQAVEYSYNSLFVTPAAPRATDNPTITNVTDPGAAPALGDELSCAKGTWRNTPTSFDYQWLRSGAPIGGATGSTYTVTATDVGKGLQCSVTAHNGAGSTQAVSARVVTAGGPPGTPVNPFLETFGSAAQPSFGYSEGLAIDQASGDLYVMDLGEGADDILRYHADGTPDNFSALGTNVLEDVLGTECSETKAHQIAVDHSGGPTDGNIYIVQRCNSPTKSGNRVRIFSSTGAELGSLTQAGETNLNGIAGVTVDSAGAVYVTDGYSEYIRKYVPSGSAPVNEDYATTFTSFYASQLAAGMGPTDGYLFASSYGGEVVKMDSTTGEVKYTVTNGATTVAVDPVSGYVIALKENGFKVYDASGPSSATLVSKANVSGGEGIAVRGSTGNIYVSKPSTHHVLVFGPAEPSGPEPPELVSVGSVYGTPQVGNGLYCEPGTWNGEPTSFSYQWLRDGVAIGGATEQSYTVVEADQGAMVECRVTATNAEGSTIAINADEGAKYVPEPGGPPPAGFGGAHFPDPEQFTLQYTYDGIYNGYVFYTDRATPWGGNQYWDTPGDLFTVDLATGKIQPVSPDTTDSQFVNISEDGSHAFFVSRSQHNGEGQAGKPNLYVWSRSDGSIKYITTVGERDVNNYGANGEAGLTNVFHGLTHIAFDNGKAMDHSRVTPDGEAFAFESSAPVPGFDNTEAKAEDCGAPWKGKQPCNEVYYYDVEAGELHCVSCGAGSGPATGEARLQGIARNQLAKVEPTNAIVEVQSLTEDGEELFFETSEGLVPRDQNETKDVYRWKKGAGVALISSGQSLYESALWSVTPDGSNAFIATRQQLLPQDENGTSIRFYDARVNGGFPPPEATVTEPCSNDVCQGQASAPPEEPQLSSSSINGAGDFAGKIRCGKKLRRVTRHGKEVCVRRRHHKHKRHHAKHRKGHSRRAAR